MERYESTLVLGIDICSVLQKVLHHVQVVVASWERGRRQREAVRRDGEHIEVHKDVSSQVVERAEREGGGFKPQCVQDINHKPQL